MIAAYHGIISAIKAALSTLIITVFLNQIIICWKKIKLDEFIDYIGDENEGQKIWD